MRSWGFSCGLYDIGKLNSSKSKLKVRGFLGNEVVTELKDLHERYDKTIDQSIVGCGYVQTQTTQDVDLGAVGH